ncbi:MAG: pantoate--beta-alanine ligase [Kiritimatiellae bacterium]|nr:pantoate--beta-alanine ligase [Kiritimatiellia bacterium]
MRIFRDAAKLQKWCMQQKRMGKRMALVPTMGYLHEGHLSLIETAKKNRADEIVVSVFVNPVQFGPNEDYATYPRNEKSDLAKCRKAGASAVFLPTPEALYAPDHSVYVNEERLSTGLCGARRPGHFRGVCTVVAKLFNLAQPDFAVFGQKDFQQAAVINRMVRDINFPVEIVVAPIVREESGLAKSSRNTYLSDAEKASALAIFASLRETAGAVAEKGSVPWKSQKARIVRKLEKAGLKVDYAEAVDAATLEDVKTLKPGNAVLVAAFAGRTRLIDNIIV